MKQPKSTIIRTIVDETGEYTIQISKEYDDDYFVNVRTPNKDSEHYYGGLTDMTITAELARTIGEALIAAADECGEPDQSVGPTA